MNLLSLFDFSSYPHEMVARDVSQYQHVVCMVSDFFYPNMGGVENHIFQVSQCLMARGHKVVVVTHSYGDRVGVRYLSKFLKVYYLPLYPPFYNQVIFPSVIGLVPILRDIFIRERIEILHCHGAFSTLGLEAIVVANCFGLKTVFTDHSLFGFADASAILMNKVLEICLSSVSFAICVSYISKENTYLRTKMHPEKIYVIPNAVDTKVFLPDPSARDPDHIVIAVMSRLVYRKGMDLVAGVLPEICGRHKDVRFLIGGDGPKRRLLDEVTFLGGQNHSDVPKHLVKADIFLNPSLTEAFCVAMCEAVSCGLQVVSTNVGGIPEVLPTGMAELCEPSVESLCEGLEKCIQNVRDRNTPDPWSYHDTMEKLYNWYNIAERTERVYNAVRELPPTTCAELLSSAYSLGPIIGKLVVIIYAIIVSLLWICDFIWPKANIDIVPAYGFYRMRKSNRYYFSQ